MTAPSSNRGASMRSLLAMAGVAGLAMVGSMLMPSANANVTIGAAVDSPGSIILGGLSSVVPKPDSVIKKYLVPGLVNITNVGVEVNSSTRVIIHAGASLKNPFGAVSLPLGQVGMGIWLDGQNLANITTSDLTLPAGTAPINVTATVDISNGADPAIKNSIKNLVTSFVGGNTPDGPAPSLVVSNITLSGTSLDLAPVSIPTQITPSATNTTTSTEPPVVGLGDIIDLNATLTMPTLQKVVFKAVSGAQLTAGVGFSWYNPLKIAVDVPYVSIDIGLNSTRILTVGIESFHMAPGNMTADTLVDLKFNNDPQAATEVAKFVHDFLAGELQQTLNIGNLTFGTSGTNSSDLLTSLNTLFSGLTFDAPLAGINTTAINTMILNLAKPYLPFPIDISNLGGSSGSSLLQYLKSLAISTAVGHTLLIEPKIEIPFAFQLDLNIPYLSLDINLNNNLLGSLFIANLIGSGQGNVEISVGIGIVFSEPSPQIPPTIAQLVNGLTAGTPYNISAGISNLAIGMSPADAINTLNDLNIAVPISSVVSGTINLDTVLTSVVDQTNVTIANNAINVKVGTLAQVTINGASLAVLPNNLISAAINLDLFLGLPVAANIGYLGIQLSLDDAQLASIALNTGLVYNGGTAKMDAGVAISVGTGQAIRTNVANLVNAIIAGQTVSSTIGVSGIVIGQSSTDLINALSEVSVKIPLGGLIGGVAVPTLPSNFLNSTLSELGLSVSNISLATIPNAGLSIGAKATFSNPIPVSVSVPFIGISGGLDNIDILSIGIDNLDFIPGANALQAEIDLNFNNALAAQTKVATFVGEILGGQLGNTPEALTAHNLRIGASPSDYFDLLSDVDVSIPTKDILNTANADLLMGKLGLNITQLASSLLGDIQIGAISADLTQAPVIELGTSVSISNVSLNAAVNIGYFGVDLALDNDALAHVAVPSITITTADNKLTLSIQAAVTVQDSPAIETDIANLVNYFMSNTTTSPVNNLVISSPVLGVSASDNIQTLSQVKVPISLPTLLAEAKTFVSQLITKVMGGLNTSNLAISNVVLDLNSPSVINFQGGIEVKNLTLPADIKISYVGVSLGLDSTPLANLTVPSLSLVSANNSLSVNVQALINVIQGQALNTQIANLVGSLLYPGQVTPPTDLVIYDPVFGGDANHLFHILSKIKVNVALAPYLTQISTLLSGAVGSSSSLLSGLDIGSLVVNLNSPQTIGIDAAISIKNVTIPAEIKLNYVGVNLAIGTAGLANIAVPSFTLQPANGALAITAHVDVTMLTSDQLTTSLTNLITGVINNQTLPATNVVISGAVFGGSPTNVFTILQDIAIPINIAPYVNMVPALLSSQSSLLDRVAIGSLVVDLNSPQTIGIDTSVSIKNVTLPAQIQLNYLGANVALAGIPLAQVGVPSFTMTANNGNLDISLHVNLALQQSDSLTQKINGLAQAVLAGQQLPATAIEVSGIAFGGSSTNVFTFLQGVSIPLDITSTLNQGVGMLSSLVGTSLMDRIAISNVGLDLNSPQVVGVDASILVKNISLPAQIELNYVGANVAINSSPLAQVAVPKFTMAPQGSDLALTVHVDLTLLSSPGLSSTISGLIADVLGNQTLPQTNLVLSGAVFGASSTNVFTIAQGVIIPINITPYITQIGSLLGGAGSLLNGLGLSGLAINLNQAPVIGIDANIAIRNISLPATLSVGYVGLNIGINDVPLVNVGLPKIQLGSSGNDLTIATHIDAKLQETDASETLVAGLVNAVVAGQVPQGTIDISGITFGPSSTNVFTILQGVEISIPLSKVLSLVPTSSSTNATSIMNALSLESADINMKNPPSIGADIAVALLGYQFDAQLLLSYVSISAFLDTTPLATITVPSISLKSGSNQVDLSVNALVNLASNSDIQTKVAAIVNEVIGNGGSQTTNLVVSNIAFGGSSSSVFHILDKVQVSVPLTPYIQQLTGVVGGVLGGNTTTSASSSALSVTQLDISATSANALSVAVGASISGIGSKISVEMPYVGLQVTADGTPFINPVINNFQLQNGQVSLTLSLPFQSAASSIIASLSTPVSELMFTSVGTVSGSIVAGDIVFGASASQSFDIASKVSVSIQLNSVFQKAQAYINAHNPLHITDMNTVLTATGIQATLALPGIPLGSLPLKMNFPITLSASYKGSSFISIEATSMSLAQSPWSLGATIDTIQPAFGTAMNGILPNVLEWKNALQDVTLGGITLGSFTALQGLTISPPSVTLWSPITVPLTGLTPHLIPLGMDFSATFVNNGPLQVDVGSIDIMVMKGPSTQVLEIQNLGGPIHINNINQSSGNNKLSLNASLKFNILELIPIIAALTNPGANFQFVFSFKTSSGQAMPWMQDALNGLPATLFANLLPILANALQNVKFTL